MSQQVIEHLMLQNLHTPLQLRMRDGKVCHMTHMGIPSLLDPNDGVREQCAHLITQGTSMAICQCANAVKDGQNVVVEDFAEEVETMVFQPQP